MRYYVVYRESLEELIKEVNRLMSEGWRPQGGIDVVAVTFNPGLFQSVSERFAQAMVSETE
jgi:tRNA A37 threonylcarbamoyltransferase TsaD